MITDADIEAMPVAITGTLKNARRNEFKDGKHQGDHLSGMIYGDTRGRFKDGDCIHTSRIQRERGDIFETLYSTYKVEFAEGKK
jgi:hypothetical protein